VTCSQLLIIFALIEFFLQKLFFYLLFYNLNTEFCQSIFYALTVSLHHIMLVYSSACLYALSCYYYNMNCIYITYKTNYLWIKLFTN